MAIEPSAEVVVKDQVKAPELRPPESIGIDVTQDVGMTEEIRSSFMDVAATLRQATSDIGTDAATIRGLSESYLRGEIPADVQSQIRRMTSERGLASAIGRGQAGQALTARDLGLTSVQMQEAGMGMRTQAAGLTQTAAGVASALADLTEKRYQFDKSYELEANKLMEDIRRTNVDVTRIDQARRQFNATQNMKLVELVASMAEARARIQASMAASDDNDENVRASMDQVISQLDSLIKKTVGST